MKRKYSLLDYALAAAFNNKVELKRPAKRKNQICPVCWKLVYKPILARKNIYIVQKFIHEECLRNHPQKNIEILD